MRRSRELLWSTFQDRLGRSFCSDAWKREPGAHATHTRPHFSPATLRENPRQSSHSHCIRICRHRHISTLIETAKLTRRNHQQSQSKAMDHVVARQHVASTRREHPMDSPVLPAHLGSEPSCRSAAGLSHFEAMQPVVDQQHVPPTRRQCLLEDPALHAHVVSESSRRSYAGQGLFQATDPAMARQHPAPSRRPYPTDPPVLQAPLVSEPNRPSAVDSSDLSLADPLESYTNTLSSFLIPGERTVSFQDLPLELRNMVYCELVTAFDTIDLYRYNYVVKLRLPPALKALTQVCSSTRFEAYTAFLATNTFRVTLRPFVQLDRLASRSTTGIDRHAPWPSICVGFCRPLYWQWRPSRPSHDLMD